MSAVRRTAKKFKPNIGDWINSSFETEFQTAGLNSRSSSSKKPESKQKKNIYKPKGQPKISANENIIWSDCFSPMKKDDLAVHKKKVAEVEDWLRKHFQLCSDDNLKIAPILLLTGPAGVGKTATIKALSKELNFEISEWSSHPFESVPNLIYVDGIRQPSNAMIDSMTQNQLTVFRNFLLQANKYQSLLSKNVKKIILVEEFPNVFLKDSSSFHALLRSFSKSGKCPAVYIVSDCTSGPSLENNLFPKDLQQQLKISNISFNPIAPTMLTKALSSICFNKKDFSSRDVVSKADLDEIVSNCKGDIRNAINALQFLAVGKKPKDRKKAISNEKSQCNRDTSLYLFHALGKILYCKRDPSLKQENACQLPLHLSHFNRDPVISNPEDVFEKTSISSESFSLFLHENYLSFTDDIEVSSNCAVAFSDADLISIEWSSKSILDKYTSSLAARGLMFNMTQNKSNYRWKAIRKPQYYDNTKNCLKWQSMLRNTFKETKLSLSELHTELVPYLAKIRPPVTDAQAKAVNSIGILNMHKMDRLKVESLNEKDMVEDNADVQLGSTLILTPLTNAVTSNLKEDSDEEIVIEECDF